MGIPYYPQVIHKDKIVALTVSPCYKRLCHLAGLPQATFFCG